MPGRTIAIGDIHGCSRAIKSLIETIQPSEADRIILLGDYVDRGPDSRGVIDRLIELCTRCRLIPLLGNHDQMMLDAIDGAPPFAWYENGGLEAIDSYGPGRDPGAIPKEHADFLRSCLSYFETESHIFVHANYDPDVAMKEQGVAMLRWASLRSFIPGPHESGKTVIAGHSSQKSGKILDLGHLICIDTYCYGGGWLSALEIASGQVWQVDRKGNPNTRRSAVRQRGTGGPSSGWAGACG
ncbi:metallophosphoesterase family protein [Tundrisphaera lichenicola]|uniref:metallophosphoesterase family protein n=1 Tax=Tundrisphaera lichenicola TaxID=2029860 RepID=UPI003EB89199